MSSTSSFRVWRSEPGFAAFTSAGKARICAVKRSEDLGILAFFMFKLKRPTRWFLASVVDWTLYFCTCQESMIAFQTRRTPHGQAQPPLYGQFIAVASGVNHSSGIHAAGMVAYRGEGRGTQERNKHR